MSDHTTLHMAIRTVDLPAGYAEAIRDEFSHAVGVEPQPDGDLTDVQGDAGVGAVYDLADALVELMKGRTPDEYDEPLPPFQFSFDVWQEPFYEYLGTVIRYRPGQDDIYTADSDGSGNPVLPFTYINAAITATDTYEGLRAALRTAYGEAD